VSAPFDIFLSYNRADKDTVRVLAEALRERKVRVWRDEDNLPLGLSWQKLVQEVIPTAPAAAAVIGPSGIGDWQGREIEACQTQNVKRRMPLIPILLPGAPDPSTLPFLSELTWFDLREGLTDKALGQLARRIPKGPSESEPRLPGAGPRLHNLPFLSLGDLLKGRDEDLERLAASLQRSSRATVITQRQVIHGLGGIGKTRLAVEYAWRFGDRYETVFFAGADTPETLWANLATLADPKFLNLLERQTSAEAAVVGAVLRWFRENDRWLLILDNVDTEEAERAVLSILPSIGSGQVLVTSRRADWPSGVEEQSLDKLSSEEATLFLLERTDKKRVKTANDGETACELTRILDGLPLALEQAAAYIAHHRISFAH
jgi:TIR domain/NB-ARC domain